ncbi:MAG: hypothetical protein JWO69_1915 [Thermoleophilia bacterium]|nr:hypothetical protein [Thermoleophilia bacterium]
MRYVMRQKIISWGDDFTIKDADGRDAYRVDGKVLSFGDKLRFLDAQSGAEVARIDQRLLSFGPTYEITRGGQHVATVKKKLFTLFRAKFTVDVPGPDDLEATGSFLDHEYTFARAGRTVASVSKRYFSFTDTYGLDIAPGEDDVLILASAVVIDLCIHDDKKD